MTPSATARNPRDEGLQAQRTGLSWTRTSFAVLANGALLTIKGLRGYVGPVAMIPPILAAAVALCAYVIALQRKQTLARHPLPRRITPVRQVYLIGIAVLLLIVVTTVAEVVEL